MRIKIILNLGILVLLSLFFSRFEPDSSFLVSSASAQDVLESLEQNITSLVESVKPSLVTIEAGIFPEGRGKLSEPASFVGSGVIYSPDGYILTTSSVVRGMKDFRVIGSDKKEYEAKLIGTDYQTNLAVLKIDAKGLRPAELGNSDKTKEGSWVTVVGNSYGLPTAVSFGIVNGIRDDKTIQMSVNVSPGNSGGPVLNTRGKVIGLVSAKLSEPSVMGSVRIYEEGLKRSVTIPPTQIEVPSSGISLAIPMNSVKEKADWIIKHGSSIEKGYLGVYLADLDEQTKAEIGVKGGVLVDGVVQGSPADKAGLRDQDVVVEFNDEKVEDSEHFRELIESTRPDKSVRLRVLRNGKERILSARLGRAGPDYSFWTGLEKLSEALGKANFEQVYDEQQSKLLESLDKAKIVQGKDLTELRKEMEEFKKELVDLSKEIEKLSKKMEEEKK
ncbi:MAG: trypsin-like peptidase domain-containing protein [candidate division Zixibacteria bacterium]|nr:trypsin-like peptidase domain-containing protein [candidate division Zixibacteria bacterium]